MKEPQFIGTTLCMQVTVLEGEFHCASSQSHSSPQHTVLSTKSIDLVLLIACKTSFWISQLDWMSKLQSNITYWPTF